ncbi:DUF6233 domain-containing protein [Streptomyces sp. NPDC007148]|uniref:DUF6233 domain-containing protein n=1 Tax=Streptomyces sp. NPDC007148 TaxID=3364775 RepID=UPI0036856852
MPDLPPDPERLRVLLAWLTERREENETVGIWLRLQRDAVERALDEAEGGTAAEKPALQPEPQPEPAPERPSRGIRPLHTFTQRAGGGSGGSSFLLEYRAQGVGERVIVHADDCDSAGDGKPIGAHDAQAAIVGGAAACAFCQPDIELGITKD